MPFVKGNPDYPRERRVISRQRLPRFHVVIDEAEVATILIWSQMHGFCPPERRVPGIPFH